MKNKNLFILPALVLAISLAFANATYANTANGDSVKVVEQHNCCCKKCDCKNCACPCQDGNCQTCKVHSRLNSLFNHDFCKCCKHPVNS